MIDVPSFRLLLLGLLGCLSMTGGLALSAERSAKPPAPPDALFLDGKLVGFPESVRGGFPVATRNPISGQLGVSQPGGVWETVSITPNPPNVPVLRFSFAAGMTAFWYNWVASELSGTTSQSFAIVWLRSDGVRRISEVEGEAHLAGIGFPALDRALSGDARFEVEVAIRHQPKVRFLPSAAPPAALPAPLSQPATGLFRLSLQNLEADSIQAVSVSAFSVRRALDPSTKTPTGLFSATNLIVRLPQAAATSFQSWYTQSVLVGERSERSGLLEYMDQSGRVIGSAGLLGVGILRFNPVVQNGVALIEVELYCQRVVLNLAGLAAL